MKTILTQLPVLLVLLAACASTEAAKDPEIEAAKSQFDQQKELCNDTDVVRTFESYELCNARAELRYFTATGASPSSMASLSELHGDLIQLGVDADAGKYETVEQYLDRRSFMIEQALASSAANRRQAAAIAEQNKRAAIGKALQDFGASFQRPRPITTNCNSYGSSVNCTTY